VSRLEKRGEGRPGLRSSLAAAEKARLSGLSNSMAQFSPTKAMIAATEGDGIHSPPLIFLSIPLDQLNLDIVRRQYESREDAWLGISYILHKYDIFRFECICQPC